MLNRPQIEWQTIQAKADGNCAFNAFILGLKDLVENGWQPQEADKSYHDFLLAFHKETGKAATWAAFIAYLREKDASKLQESLHKFFREFTIDVLLDQEYSENLSIAVKAEFRNYVLKQLGTPVPQTKFSQDDICARLNCVKQKFAMLFESQFASTFETYKQLAASRTHTQEKEFVDLRAQLEKQITAVQDKDLQNGWESLYTQCKGEMKKPGFWLGHEIAWLAKYFCVGFNVQRKGKITQLHSAEASAPVITLENQQGLHWDLRVQKKVEVKEIPSPVPASPKAIEENKWKKILEQVGSAVKDKKLTKDVTVGDIKIEPADKGKGVAYTFIDRKTNAVIAEDVIVTIDSQVKLDGELAEELDRELNGPKR